MPLLRLTQTAVTDASWRVELALEREDALRQSRLRPPVSSTGTAEIGRGTGHEIDSSQESKR